MSLLFPLPFLEPSASTIACNDSSRLFTPPLSLPVPLRVDLRRERILPLPRQQIHGRHLTR